VGTKRRDSGRLTREDLERLTRKTSIAHLDLLLVKIDCRPIIIDKQIKDGPAHGDYRGRCIDTIGIGPAAKFLDLDSGFAFDQIERFRGEADS
jgi:hypothetical protein